MGCCSVGWRRAPRLPRRPAALAGKQPAAPEGCAGEPRRACALVFSLILTALLLLPTVAAQWLTPRQMMAEREPMPVLEQLVPQQMGDWLHDQGAVLLVAADLQANVQRLYRADPVANLCSSMRRAIASCCRWPMAGGSWAMVQAHQPEFCYQAQGFSCWMHINRCCRWRACDPRGADWLPCSMARWNRSPTG